MKAESWHKLNQYFVYRFSSLTSPLTMTDIKIHTLSSEMFYIYDVESNWWYHNSSPVLEGLWCWHWLPGISTTVHEGFFGRITTECVLKEQYSGLHTSPFHPRLFRSNTRIHCKELLCKKCILGNTLAFFIIPSIVLADGHEKMCLTIRVVYALFNTFVFQIGLECCRTRLRSILLQSWNIDLLLSTKSIYDLHIICARHYPP